MAPLMHATDPDDLARDDRRAADAAIVIFGAAVRPDGSPSETLRRRVEAAARFGALHRAPLFIPTGAVGRFGDSEASVMASLLRELGVAGERILLEETARNTISSVRAVAELLRSRHIRRPVYAATSAYHLPRCLLLLRLAGVPARACPPPALRASDSFWMRWYWRLREVTAIPVDLLMILGLRVARRL
jgi:uncharacterized SAM-binding protein YcdF (DUF218 family)